MISVNYDNGERVVEFFDFDHDDSELIMPWVRDQFHDLDSTLFLESRHISAFSSYLLRLQEDPKCSVYLGALQEFLTLSWFVTKTLGWTVTLELDR